MKPSWTQPICDPCYGERFPDAVPFRFLRPEKERCSFCGQQTESGIYVRASPADVPYPAVKEG